MKEMSEGQITIINSKEEYDDLTSGRSTKGLIVVDFSADWCGPCRQIAPTYKRLSKEFKKVTFASVDVDEHEDIAEREEVTVMPVFRFYKHGKKIDQVTGGNKEQLREKLEMYQ
ncbi:thioredoxin-like [Dendronephthya gigantea]|uniref:thioredoxin-like n=1 Tax=Dendronephthya gigantea TaxID=151771 RepID=UPI00106C6627|nr:thioredoxin-like [Dendronephthya gigantea]XP_028404484.1 thioredoxin-like [Dendronephthya gigantea]